MHKRTKVKTNLFTQFFFFFFFLFRSFFFLFPPLSFHFFLLFPFYPSFSFERILHVFWYPGSMRWPGGRSGDWTTLRSRLSSPPPTTGARDQPGITYNFLLTLTFSGGQIVYFGESFTISMDMVNFFWNIVIGFN